MAIDRRAQCHQWNSDQAHQIAAGKARACSFTHAHQVAAGMASFQAFSARMRAEHGSPQLFPQEAARYVAPEQIRCFAGPLPLSLQRIIHAAWAAGHGGGIDYWLANADAAFPVGSLFGPDDDDHPWAVWEVGWFVCPGCFAAAICPQCLPTWPDDRVLSRLLPVRCDQHSGGW